MRPVRAGSCLALGVIGMWLGGVEPASSGWWSRSSSAKADRSLPLPANTGHTGSEAGDFAGFQTLIAGRAEVVREAPPPVVERAVPVERRVQPSPPAQFAIQAAQVRPVANTGQKGWSVQEHWLRVGVPAGNPPGNPVRASAPVRPLTTGVPVQPFSEPVAGDPMEGAPTLIRRELPPRSLVALLDGCAFLSHQGLSYQYGSSDPRQGGLDCSGTVQYLLKSTGFTSVPRQANTLYQWLDDAGTLTKIRPWTSSDKALAKLRQGDLLFWKGTYNVKRVPNVTHVMVYVGRDSQTGKRLMFGASSRRSKGRNGNAVDVYEFRWPESYGKGKFIGFGTVPGIRSGR